MVKVNTIALKWFRNKWCVGICVSKGGKTTFLKRFYLFTFRERGRGG